MSKAFSCSYIYWAGAYWRSRKFRIRCPHALELIPLWRFQPAKGKLNQN